MITSSMIGVDCHREIAFALGARTSTTLADGLMLRSAVRIPIFRPIDFRPDDLDLLWKRSR